MTATCRYRWNMGSTRCALPEGHGPLPDGSEHANAQAVEMASLRADVARLQAARDEARERAERLTVERDDLQAQTRRMFSAMASIKARRDEDRRKRRAAEERAERAERVLIPSLDCRYTGAGIADISGSHCPIEAPCQRCDLEREIRAAEAEAASLRSALEGVAERRMIPGDGSYCFCFEFRGRHDDYCEEARAALRSPGTPSGRAE